MQKSLGRKDKIIEDLIAQNEASNNKIKLLEQKIDYLLRQQFLSKSEKLPDGQLSLFADLENKEVEEEKEEEIRASFNTH